MSGTASLDADRWQALVDFLGEADPGGTYERVRRRLITMFECRGVSDPERLADVTLDRVAKKLAEGLEVKNPDPLRYVLGVARFVALEDRRGAPAQPLDRPVADPAVAAREEAAEHERYLAAMETCLGGMHAAEARVLLEYHRGLVGRAKAAHRRKLAEDLQITEVNLRSRAKRLRRKLKDCVEAATKQPDDAPGVEGS